MGYRVETCKLRNCSICGDKHHTFLHRHQDDVSAQPTASTPSTTPTSWQSTRLPFRPIQQIALSIDIPGDDILSTAVLQTFNRSSQLKLCLILLDTGSSANFITTEIVDQLQLRKTKCSVSLGDLIDLSTVANYYGTATIRSRDIRFKKILDFLATPTISSSIPALNWFVKK